MEDAIESKSYIYDQVNTAYPQATSSKASVRIKDHSWLIIISFLTIIIAIIVYNIFS